MTTLPIPRINLLPAQRLAGQRRQRRIRVWIAPVAIYLAALGGVWFACSGGSHAASLASEVTVTTAKIDATKKELATVSQKILATRHQLDAAKAVGNHPDWSVLLKLLANAGEDDVVLERCELRPRNAPGTDKAGPKSDVQGSQGYTLTVSGIAASQTVVFRYAASLEHLQVFESVGDIATHPRDSVAVDAPGLHLISFQLTATLTDKGAAHWAASTDPKSDAPTGGKDK
jgi:hypothetical protein